MELSAKGAYRTQKIAEVLKLAKILTESLIADKVISSDEAIIISYGLENLMGNLLCLFVMIAIGGIFDHFADSFFVWLLAFPLRKYAGGFHAKTKAGCLVLSIGMIFCAYAIFFLFEWTILEMFLAMLAPFMVIFFLAPVGSPNKPLDKLEYKVYRKKARGILMLEGVLLCVAIVFQWKGLVIAITISFFMVGISVFAGKIIYLNKW